MQFERYTLKQEFVIEKLITFFYFELKSDFYTIGEKHDFWELVYVDKGEFEVFTDNNQYVLKQGDCVFYKPNEFHKGRAHRNIAPNLIILTFECSSQHMNFFECKSFRFQEQERGIVKLLVQAGIEAFSPSVDSPFMDRPKQRIGAPVGCEQLIKNYLEILLILLFQKGDSSIHVKNLPTLSKEKTDQAIIDKSVGYMQENLASGLLLEDVSKASSISKSLLKSVFKERTGLTTMRYFNKMRIDRARQLIRDGNFTLTEIAEKLGFSSIHYFSKQFKKITGMNPTEYARTVKCQLPRRKTEEQFLDPDV